ncbi:MAG: beta-ketoacyl-[acyl-carrier-protein] synthase family protein [Nitrospiraceae bacterium]|nr:beta-ketoacyl-[acyl-carrier-protein] synthase family protein [Nitrospiraceae bacterium]
MAPLVLSAYTLVSALGKGLEPTYRALRDRRSGLRPCDFEDVGIKTYIGRVDGLEDSSAGCGSTAQELEQFDCRNNRLALLGLQQDRFMQAASEARDRYGAHRVAVILGTSTSGILETEHAYHERDPQTGVLPASFTSRYRYTHNMFSLAHFVRTCLNLRGPAMVISTACSSSAKAFATASRFIETGFCDAAIVGGVDSLCLTTLYGFSSLELMSSDPCRPCDEDRDGLTLGEAAGFALLEKADRAEHSGAVALLGYGESCDGYHMSHPHPEGAGAIRAMHDALRRSGLTPGDIDYINLHGTATRANDSIEDKAVSSVFDLSTPCSSTKGWTGHTLGAAGITEAVIAAMCLTHSFVPGTLNTTRVDPNLRSYVLLENREQPVRRVLSNIFGFGGNNCSMILGTL